MKIEKKGKRREKERDHLRGFCSGQRKTFAIQNRFSAPSLHLLADGEADRLKLYVQNGGTLVGTFNTGLVNEYCIVPDTGYPNDID